MSYTDIFMRHEIKFLLSAEQEQMIMPTVNEYMECDRYGQTTIRNIYYDTADFRLIRNSIEKPIYKEKLRVRTYSKLNKSEVDCNAFVELKKKYKGVVYKRRILLPYDNAEEWLNGGGTPEIQNQISREIDYFKKYYESLLPRVFLSYDRMAYKPRGDGDLRITFDKNILARDSELTLYSEPGGLLVNEQNFTVMEIKCSLGIPLWLTNALSAAKAYKSSFSKYGMAYTKYFSTKTKGYQNV